MHQPTQINHQTSSSQHHKSERIDKFISNQITDVTRTIVKQYLKKGLVKVNGVVVKKAEYKINPETDIVMFNGRTIEYKKNIYIMLNKPKGVVCSTKDGLSPTVLSLVPKSMQRKGLFPAGRLDKDTEGFVLITDDGDLAHRMLSPKHHVSKVYYVELEKEYDDSYDQKFKDGIQLKTGEKCLPAEFHKGKNSKSCYVVLHEGMYHQVKKMFEKLENKVTYLKRVQIGSIKLDSKLALGESIEILYKNIEKILINVAFTPDCD